MAAVYSRALSVYVYVSFACLLVPPRYLHGQVSPVWQRNDLLADRRLRLMPLPSFVQWLDRAQSEWQSIGHLRQAVGFHFLRRIG